MSLHRISLWAPLPLRRIIAAIMVILQLTFTGYARAVSLYLPLISRQPTQTLQNGDFETVPNVSWKEENSYSYSLIVEAANLLEGITPQSGSRAVWLLGDFDEESRLSQVIYIPTNADSLIYSYWIRSDETGEYCGVDQAYVRLAGKTLVTYELCKPNNTGKWAEGRINLSSYRGQVVELVFGGATDSDVYSDFFLDTVYITTLAGSR
jgi:hypothetical protein